MSQNWGPEKKSVSQKWGPEKKLFPKYVIQKIWGLNIGLKQKKYPQNRTVVALTVDFSHLLAPCFAV